MVIITAPNVTLRSGVGGFTASIIHTEEFGVGGGGGLAILEGGHKRFKGSFNTVQLSFGHIRDLISERRCTLIHCLCNAYLGCAYLCCQVALQSVAIANALG